MVMGKDRKDQSDQMCEKWGSIT